MWNNLDYLMVGASVCWFIGAALMLIKQLAQFLPK